MTRRRETRMNERREWMVPTGEERKMLLLSSVLPDRGPKIAIGSTCVARPADLPLRYTSPF